MLKISPKTHQKIGRYLYKNTIRAKYNRNMDTALMSGIATGVEVLRFPHWDVHDIGLTALFGTIYLKNAGQALKNLLKLQPLRKRAIQIKKAAKAVKNNS